MLRNKSVWPHAGNSSPVCLVPFSYVWKKIYCLEILEGREGDNKIKYEIKLFLLTAVHRADPQCEETVVLLETHRPQSVS